MKAKTIITTTILSIISISITICGDHVSALEYSSSAGVNFTITPSIQVSVSGDLIIDELAPGSSSDSNIIDVTVLSNNNTGYTLSSTVGNSSDSNYTDLRLNDNSNGSNSNENINKFTNLSTNKASLSNFDDNSWGYSYSIDSGTNWISGNTGSTANGYNGLPIYSSTGIKLVDTTAIGTNTIKFKIGAKASNTQAAGEYTNIVNFAAVGKAAPVSFYDAFKEAAAQPGSTITMLNGYYKMQDMSTTICNNVYTSQLTDNSDTMEAQLIDVRDNNVYTVAKLKDNRCWMTSNLNLAGGTALSADTTDVEASYINSFTTSNNLIKSGDAIVLPVSSTTGFSTQNYSYVYNSGNITNNQADCTDTQPCNSYYSWDAATLGSGRSITTEDTDAPYSICPKDWKLPTSGDKTVNDPTGQSGWKRGDFYRLATAYEIDLFNSSDENIAADEGVATPNDKIGPGTVVNFLRAYEYDRSSFKLGSSVAGRYWSSTSAAPFDNGNITAHVMILGIRNRDHLNYVNSADKENRRGGVSIRCIANN